jgi:hypothetical protein
MIWLLKILNSQTHKPTIIFLFNFPFIVKTFPGKRTRKKRETGNDMNLPSVTFTHYPSHHLVSPLYCKLPTATTRFIYLTFIFSFRHFIKQFVFTLNSNSFHCIINLLMNFMYLGYFFQGKKRG